MGSYLEPRGAIWSQLDPFGAFLSNLEQFGAIWISFDLFKSIESHLEPLEPFEAIQSARDRNT